MRRSLLLHFSAAMLSLALSAATIAAEPHPPLTETHQVPIEQQVEIAQSMADHEQVAQRFDEEADELDRKAAAHERLTQSYRRGAGGGPKADTTSLAKHCEALARSLRAAANEARTMAAMHRNIAHRLVK